MFRRRVPTRTSSTSTTLQNENQTPHSPPTKAALGAFNSEMLIGGLTFLSTVGPRRFRGHAQGLLTVISVVSLAMRAIRRK